MASETLAEPASPAGGTPADEREVSPTTPGGEAASEEKVVEKRKRGRKRKEEGSGNKEEKKRRLAPKEAATPSVERPSRERKTVERLVQMSPRKVSVSKLLSVEQGPGTKLKDIPNVNFKISKRKTDENLQSLHTILFGRKSKAHFLKRNIFQFSGFVWSENEEKLRFRVKEKLDKCNKDRLLDFSELLDIQIARATTKKEEITEKLLEFLKSPHATREVVLAEKEKKGKSKRRTKGTSQATTGASSERTTKKHKDVPTEVMKERKRSGKAKKIEEESSQVGKEDIDVHDSDDSEEIDEGASTDKEDASDAEKNNGDSLDESDEVESEEEDEDEADLPAPSAKESGGKKKAVGAKLKEKTSPATKVSAAKNEQVSSAGSRKGRTSEGSKASSKEKAPPLKSSPKTSKNITKSTPRKSSVDESQPVSRASPKSRKDNKKEHPENENQALKDKISSKKPGAKSLSKQSTKEQAKVKDGEGAKVGPTREELHSVVSNLLKEVDFNTATLADILKQLGAHFNTDLMNRKAEVKGIIEEVINNMTDDEDGEGEEDAEGGNPKEESDPDEE